MKYSCFILLIFLFGSCSNNNQEQVAHLSQQLDSTRILLDSLIKMQSSISLQGTTGIPLNKEDSSLQEQAVDAASNRSSDKPQRPIPEKPIEKTRPPQIKSEAEPKVYLYKNSNKVSVQVIPGAQRSKDFVLFDPLGNETYRLEQHIESYSITVDLLEWHSNGAIHKVKVHTNPGASMYWYETLYTFGINNEPQWKVSTQFPQNKVSMESDNSYYWDAKTKSWKKQEAVYEQPVPRD